MARGTNPSSLANIDLVATEPGIYWVNSSDTAGTYPAGLQYGLLVVLRNIVEVGQLFFHDTGLWWRFNVNDQWTPWSRA